MQFYWLLRWALRLLLWSVVLILFVGVWIGLSHTFDSWLLSIIPAGIAVVWILRMNAQVGVRRLIIGSLLFGACAVALFRVYTVERPDIPADTRTEVLELSMGRLPFLDEYEFVDTRENEFVVFQQPDSSPVPVAIYFDDVNSRDGEWAIQDTRVQITCDDGCLQPEATVTARERMIDWSDTDLDEDVSEVSPFLEFDLPVNDLDVHRRLDVSITGEVIYPDETTGETRREEVTRDVRVFVGTPQELETRIAYNRWQGLNRIAAMPTIAFVWVAMIAGGGVSWWGYTLATGRTGRARNTMMAHAHRDLELRRLPVASLDRYAFPPHEGAYVEQVAPGSVFARAGLITGDVIIRVGGELTEQPVEVFQALNQLREHRYVPFYVWRRGNMVELSVQFDDDMKHKNEW
ncbi:MAG: PDZ domain-containing protein [Chloroflexota bacterium]